MESSPKPRDPTKRQREIYEFVRDKIVNRGYGPTVREIGIEFGIRSPNGVMCHLKALEKKGLIVRESNMSRAIKLSNQRPTRHSMTFLGTAVSGSPIRAATHSEKCVEFSDLFSGVDRSTLKVEGSAFAPLGIADGDFLIISRSSERKPDSLIVVLDDRRHVSICRIPKNGGTPTPAISGTFSMSIEQILGVLSGVVRKL